MVSEINGASSTLIKGLEQGSANSDNTAMRVQSTGNGASRNADVVTLTDLAARLQQLTQSVANVPVVDMHRIEAFRQSVADGSYQLDTKAVAEKFTLFESLLGTVRHAA